jgi:hypothetical protein
MPRASKIPLPEKRLCKKHGRPVLVSQWKQGHRNTGCAKCLNSYPGYLKKKHRYETSDRGKIMDTRHKAGKAAQRIRNNKQRPINPLELFARITGLTLEQMNFPRR